MIKIDYIHIYSNSLHCQQIFTGFSLLIKNKILTVDNIKFMRLEGGDHFFGEPYVKVLMNSKIILFDCADSFDLPSNTHIYSDVDVIFKRSFKKDGYNMLDCKIYPYGFNYLVYDNAINWEFWMCELKASFFQKNTIHFFVTRHSLLSALFNINSSRINLSWNNIENFSCKERKGIVYNTRLWNPQNARTEEERERRLILNDRRIKVVSMLKKEYGSEFRGGIFADTMSKKMCKKDILISNSSYKVKNYLNVLKNAKIGISINGNHAAGYAFGEYISMGLGIVCDRINNLLPGEFVKNSNYLEINDDLSNLTEQINQLNTNDDLCNIMRYNNYLYYLNNLRADRIVLNALLYVL